MKQRPDLAVMDWPGLGDESLIEVTVTSPLRPSVLQRSHIHPLSAAGDAERGKWRKYSQLATDENKYLYLLAFEASGAFGQGVSYLLSKLAARHDPVAFDATSEGRTWASYSWTQYWTQIIACAFWRGSTIMFNKNAAAVRGHHVRNHFTPDEEEDGDAQVPVRMARPNRDMGCSFYQAPPLHFRQARLPHQGSAAAQHQPTPAQHSAGASHSAAQTSAREQADQPRRPEDVAGAAAS